MLNVVYRDVAFLVSTALTLLYWLAPIIYPVSFVDDGAIPQIYKTLYHLNPIASILVALRNCLMDGDAAVGADLGRDARADGAGAAGGLGGFPPLRAHGAGLCLSAPCNPSQNSRARRRASSSFG